MNDVSIVTLGILVGFPFNHSPPPLSPEIKLKIFFFICSQTVDKM